jgi:hypothetical protein
MIWNLREESSEGQSQRAARIAPRLKGRLQGLSHNSGAVIEQGGEADGDQNRHEDNHGVRFQFFSLMSLVR